MRAPAVQHHRSNSLTATSLSSVARLICIVIVGLSLSGCGILSRNSDAIPPNAAKILVRYQWTAADEKTPPVAFHVYRADDAIGPFECLTSNPIKTGSHKAGETFIVLKDVGVEMGQTYYYYLERVTPSGERAKWTSVTSATALLPLEPADHREYGKLQDVQRKKQRGKDS
ncbi:hypothetical protein KQI84_05590 [bacterium]|nr:hypothetical protein [bacterium]